MDVQPAHRLGDLQDRTFKDTRWGVDAPGADRNRGGRKQRQEIAVFNRADEERFSVIFFGTAGSARTTVTNYEGKTGEGLGSGLGAWPALEARYNATTKALRRRLNEKITTRKMKPGEDSEDFFHEMDKLQNRLEEMVNISDYRYEDIVLHAISSDYEYVRNKRYSDRTFDLDDIRTTMSNMYIDNLSCSAGDTKSVVGRGVVMQARTVNAVTSSATTATNGATTGTSAPSFCGWNVFSSSSQITRSIGRMGKTTSLSGAHSTRQRATVTSSASIRKR